MIFITDFILFLEDNSSKKIQNNLRKEKFMSEIINNRQQPIEIMKNLIRQLRNGVSEEQVRHPLETILDEADYSDVFYGHVG